MKIIAEIGINFNGSKQLAKELIDVAANTGCHFAKFQLFTAKGMYPKTAGELDWKDNEKEYSYDIFEAVKSFELPYTWVDELIAYCQTKNIEFLASVFSFEDVDFYASKKLTSIKLSSYTITNLPLIEHVAKTGMHIFMSTGGATLSEVEQALDVIYKYHKKITLLHCSIQYPSALNSINIGVLETFSKAFPLLELGYSDHTAEVSDAPIQAVYLGATVIEKHITLDKQMEGPDHFFALNPTELNQLVKDVNQAKVDYQNSNMHINTTTYGSSEKKCYPHEEYLREFCYMTLYANRAIAKGEHINASDISILRPGKKQKGLEPKYLTLFNEYTITASCDIKEEDPITWEKIL